MMTTNNKIVERAYGKIGLTDNIEGRLVNSGFEELQDLMYELRGNGTEIGYANDSEIGDNVGFDRKFNSAITALLAQRLANNLRVPIDPSLGGQIRTGTQLLARETIQNPTWKRPNRFPRGSGNNKRGYEWSHYYTNQADNYTRTRQDEYQLELVNTAYVVNSTVRDNGKHTLSFSVNGSVSDGSLKIEYRRNDYLDWELVATMPITNLTEQIVSSDIKEYRFTVSDYTGDPWTLIVQDEAQYETFPKSPQSVQDIA